MINLICTEKWSERGSSWVSINLDYINSNINEHTEVALRFCRYLHSDEKYKFFHATVWKINPDKSRNRSNYKFLSSFDSFELPLLLKSRWSECYKEALKYLN